MTPEQLFNFIDQFGEDACFKTKRGSKLCPASKLKQYIKQAIEHAKQSEPKAKATDDE